MAGAINLTPGDNPAQFLLNYDDAGKFTSVSGTNNDAAAAHQVTVTLWDPVTGVADPSRAFTLSLAPLQSGQTVIPNGRATNIVINAKGKQSGFDTAMS